MKYLLSFLMLLLAMNSNIAIGTTIYNGESSPFVAASSWDQNGSTLKQTNIAPHSPTKHLRANLVMKNWWSGVAYVPKNWQTVDMSKGTTLSLWAKSTKNPNMIIQLYDENKASSAKATVKLSASYQQFQIPMSTFTGVDLAKVTAIIFAVSSEGSITYPIDIDDIELVVGTCPCPTPTPTPPPPPPPSSGDVRTKSLQIVKDLAGVQTMLVGSGGTDDKALGLRSQIHYQYLCCGYGDTGWRGWNAPSGEYATMVINGAKANNAIPMFTYYQIAYEFEIKNYGILTSPNLHQYLLDVRLMFTKLGLYGNPAIVHFEPDFYGYLQQYAVSLNKTPSEIPAKIRYADLPECQSFPETVRGMLDCLVTMGRKLSPKVKIGFHASMWGDWYDPMTATPETIQAKGASVANFLRSCGSDATDFITLETTDRDAGYLEVARGAKNAYWDEANIGKPNFVQHFTWAKAVSQTAVKPLLWWQMPFGVPSTTPGGTDGHYRDNRLRYFFSHTKDVVGAGGFGVLFGAGADLQTTPATDGGQFKNALDAYLASPQAL